MPDGADTRRQRGGDAVQERENSAEEHQQRDEPAVQLRPPLESALGQRVFDGPRVVRGRYVPLKHIGDVSFGGARANMAQVELIQAQFDDTLCREQDEDEGDEQLRPPSGACRASGCAAGRRGARGENDALPSSRQAGCAGSSGRRMGRAACGRRPSTLRPSGTPGSSDVGPGVGGEGNARRRLAAAAVPSSPSGTSCHRKGEERRRRLPGVFAPPLVSASARRGRSSRDVAREWRGPARPAEARSSPSSCRRR